MFASKLPANNEVWWLSSLARAIQIGMVLAVICLAASAVRAQSDPAQVGEWGPLIEGFPVPAVHSIMLHTGKLLFFRGDGEDEGGVGVYNTHLMDLETFEFETFTMDANVFCAGHTFLPDGRVLVTGGEKEEDLGPRHVHIFNPITEQWSRQPDMTDGRYYPTNVAMGDGSTLIFAGRDPNGGDNPHVERFIPGGGPDGSNTVTLLAGSDQDMTWYPRMHLLPSGNVFRAGQEQASLEFNPTDGTWTHVDNSNYGERYWGTSVPLPNNPLAIMIFGGVNRAVTSNSTDTAEIIDFGEAFPRWRYTSSMHFPRTHPNVILLPNGMVFVAGGTETLDHVAFPVFASEIFDPITETWTLGPSQDSVRTYHSSSVLLPDGRVMWLGAYAETGDNTDPTAQIYSPPYLFNGPRPSITGTVESADYGVSFLVDTPEASDIASVVFIRPSATTHSINMEQRYVPLSFSQIDGDTLEVTAPTNPNLAPPGYYMLFVVDSQGRPSEAPFVRLGGDLPPVVEAGLDQEVILPSTAQLDGTIIDYNARGSLITEWSVAAGPDNVLFSDASSTQTMATFFTPGIYDLRLTAYDDPFLISDTIRVTVHPEGRVVINLSQSNDDAEEKSDGTITLTSLDLEMTDYDNGGPHAAIGLRFNNVGIANGTQIGNAYIQFKALETSATETQLTITGEATDNASGFTTSVENLTSRPKTSASVAWSVPAWTVSEAGIAQQTTNIAPIIQQIVNRPGWSAGNSLALFLSGSGDRVAVSFDSDPLGAATLYVDPAGNQACADGVDNDGDGTVDYPADPGCSNAADPSEWDAQRVCDDGIDNDGDNLIDYPEDPGCFSLLDGSESELEAACIDGADNDGDGLIDYPEDPGCSSGADTDEKGSSLVCDDGIDNDSDGFVDFPFDPGCDDAFDPAELDGLIVADFPLISPSDDAEEKANGSITTTSLDLEMFEYDAGGPHQVVGLRFDNLSVPRNADIHAAYVQFEAAETHSLQTSITIRAEATDDAPAFTTGLNDLSLRTPTLNSVNWSVDPWTDGEAQAAQRSEDISPIIQEIIGRTGWAPGNALVLLLTGVGERVAVSQNASPAAGPRLHIEYVEGNDPGGNNPPNVAITSPTDGTSVEFETELTFVGTANDNEDGNLSAQIQWTSDLDGNLGTGASVAAILSVGTHTVTADVTDSGGLSGSAQLSVTITPVEPDDLIVADFPLISPSDDAEEKADGSITTTSLDLEMFEYDVGDPHQVVGLRFDNLNVPRDADIHAAYVQFEAAETHSLQTSITIHAEATDDAPAFTTGLNDLSLRTPTLNSVNWSVDPWIDGEAQAAQRSEDISPIIQEIIGRTGWAPGNALVLLLTGVGERVAVSQNASPAAGPRLHIEYVEGNDPGGNNPSSAAITSPADGTILSEESAQTFVASVTDEGGLGATDRISVQVRRGQRPRPQ